jgi:hypothetical protein
VLTGPRTGDRTEKFTFFGTKKMLLGLGLEACRTQDDLLQSALSGWLGL